MSVPVSSPGRAVKVLAAGVTADADQIRRFQHEARAIGLLNHPNILTIHDAGRLPAPVSGTAVTVADPAATRAGMLIETARNGDTQLFAK